MFTIRVHSVDEVHLLFLPHPSSNSSNSNPSPKLAERRGIVHLFRMVSQHPSALPHPSNASDRSTSLFIVAVPNYFSSDDLLRSFGNHIIDISEMLIIRNDGMEDRYNVLIKMVNQASADVFYCNFNGKRFSPPEVEVCHILFVLSVEYSELSEIASTPPVGYCELPTCPVCLERLDQDTSGIHSTLCDHSFQCSCVSKWTYLSCPVCRLCQQQEEKPTCSVCGTSENLWICVICGFVGCGRYKEGHTIRHWKDTQHCYSLDLETQRVWDYVGDNYVHRLNHSKAEGKSVTTISQCMSIDGDCGPCNSSEDSDISTALFSSKVDAIMDEYNHLLTTQLENQRQCYAAQLGEAKSKKERVIAVAVEKAVPLRMQEAQCELEKCLKETKAVADMNQSLTKIQEEYEEKYKEIEQRMISSLRSRDEKILDLEEQIRDLKIYIEAQRTLNNTTNSDDIKGGTLLPVPLKPPPSSSNSKRRHGRLSRRHNK
ncbi:hypothetical protein Nepgr_029152 [Nepenthes gracilis]|uniref:BRCA1-associated protein n=1 Tax=Nepenthes gracilis TaxID=150966 RepID=A0AAD3TDJ8_NEPGR|nr:hypothetical protein Nepgr_029152 [Nepenthes gracilis]